MLEWVISDPLEFAVFLTSVCFQYSGQTIIMIDGVTKLKWGRLGVYCVSQHDGICWLTSDLVSVIVSPFDQFGSFKISLCHQQILTMVLSAYTVINARPSIHVFLK